MRLNYDENKLLEILKDFHIMTKMRIVIFDEDFNRVAAYPEISCNFCYRLKKNEASRELCKKNDKEACRMCKSSGSLMIYRCHAGLTEVAAPIKMNGIIFGYIMFGQIIDEKSKIDNKDKIIEYSSRFFDNKFEALKSYEELISKTDDEITAASKIMECCISYLLMNRLLMVNKGNLGYLISEYINSHISEEISADDICCAFGIGRTKLFEICTKNFGMSITRYIRKVKANAAAEYIKEHHCRVSEAADYIGFSDYNYFSKIFKMEVGASPKNFAKDLQS